MTRVGETCTLRASSWQGDPPTIGDFLRTAAGSCYRIDRVGEPGPRGGFALECTRLDRDAVRAGAPGVFEWRWDPRSKRSTQPEGGARRRA